MADKFPYDAFDRYTAFFTKLALVLWDRMTFSRSVVIDYRRQDGTLIHYRQRRKNLSIPGSTLHPQPREPDGGICRIGAILPRGGFED
jgi:hypothetical protein